MAARPRAGLLHHRFGRPRGQRRGRGRAAPDRPGAAALPLGWLLPGPRAAGGRRSDGRRARRAGRHAGAGRRADRRRAAQGVRPPRLDVIPQTSTIASHLPRALGVAFAIDRARRLDLPTRWSRDALAVCSFGDASANHSTAQGAHQRGDLHVVRRPAACRCCSCARTTGGASACRRRPGWIEHSFAQRAGLRYPQADGSDLAETFDAASELAEWVRDAPPAGAAAPAHRALHGPRRHRRRGRATDRRPSIRADGARDPLLGTARLLVDAGRRDARRAVRPVSSRVARDVRDVAESMLGLPTLHDADEVMAPLSPRRAAAGRSSRPSLAAAEAERRAFFGGTLPEDEGR